MQFHKATEEQLVRNVAFPLLQETQIIQMLQRCLEMHLKQLKLLVELLKQFPKVISYQEVRIHGMRQNMQNNRRQTQMSEVEDLEKEKADGLLIQLKLLCLACLQLCPLI